MAPEASNRVQTRCAPPPPIAMAHGLTQNPRNLLLFLALRAPLATMAIPRLLHQTCSSRAALPAIVQTHIQDLTDRNPDWTHTVYEDGDVLDYIQRHFGSEVFNTVLTICPGYGVVLADVFRYLVMYREGGVYLDIKSTAFTPLQDAIQPSDTFLLSHWKNGQGQFRENWGLHPELHRLPGGEFQQWFIVAEPGHPFLKGVIEATLHNIRHYRLERFGTGKHGVLRVSGPICYTLSILAAMDSAQAPHQIVDIEARGFEYSIWPDHFRTPSHYTQQTGAIARPLPHLCDHAVAAMP